MPKPKPHPDKTATVGRFGFVSAQWARLLLPCVLAVAPHVILAQQGTAVRPCSDRSSTNTPQSARGTKTRVGEILIDASIPADPAIEKLLKPYGAKVRALQVVIGKLAGDLIKGGMGGGTLGNFVADGIRLQSSLKLGKPVLLAITNSGGLRKNTIAEGKLRASDIFELLPFEDTLIEIDLTGEQLLKLLAVVVAGRDAQSGARITYRLNAENKPEVVSVRLVDAHGREREIDPKASYAIVTIDYLLQRAGGDYSILQQGKNPKPLGVTLREAIIDYVKAETAAGRAVREIRWPVLRT